MIGLGTIDEEFYQKLGNMLLIQRRDELNMSLRELQAKTGLSRQTLSKIERGQCRVKKEHFNIICRALQIDNKFKLSFDFNDHERLDL